MADKRLQTKPIMLRLFGSPTLLCEGEEIQLGRRKAMALLAYLAITRMPFRREELAALLWPESSADAAYAALRNALWILRQSALNEALVADRSTIRLDTDLLTIDVAEFRRLIRGCGEHGDRALGACTACEESLRQAVELVRAPLMSGFSLSDALHFDDWQIAEREALRHEFLDALGRLVIGYRDRGEWAEAAACARRWVQEDPLSEEGWREVMRALATQGQRSEALRSYAQCVSNLKSDLGVDPGDATDALAERIRTGELSPIETPAAAVPDNLPVATTAFVGRKAELAQIRERLTNDDARLVSLVGLGGSGKTRLAIEAAHELKAFFPDGVYFAPLGAVSGAASAATAISAAIRQHPGRGNTDGLEVWLHSTLRGKRMLLILDEAEHLDEGRRLLSSLLESDAEIRFLVTTRRALGLTYESTVPVHGLRFPESGTLPERIAEHDAIQLLRMAARRIDPSYVPSAKDLGAMARVAQEVDGSPLGLELSAAWTRLLSWESIAVRLTENPDFLVGEQQDLPERHRSLRSVFDQTWSMLKSDERLALREMTRFVDGFTPEAAEEIIGCSPAVLASLSAKSLIRRVGSDRYRLHALLRQFVSEHVDDDSPRTAVMEKRYTAYYMKLVEGAFVEMKGPRQLDALRRLEKDLANVRKAWLSAARRGEAGVARRAAIGLFFYYDMMSLFEEGESALGEGLDALCTSDGERGLLQGFLLVACGWFARYSARRSPRARLLDGLIMLDEEPWCPERALAQVITSFADTPEDRDECAERLQQSIDFFEQRQDSWGTALAMEALATILASDSPERAHELALHSLELRRGLGDRWGQALALFDLARMAELEGRLGQADLRYQQSQALFQQISDDLFGAIDCLIARARIARTRGETEASAELIRETMTLCSQISNAWRKGLALCEAGKLEWTLGNRELGKRHLEEALKLHQENGDSLRASACAAWLGDLCAEMGELHASEGWYHESLSMNAENERAQRGLERLAESSPK